MTKKKTATAVAGKISETGHAKNVAGFEAIISFCKGFGPKYNPVKEGIKIAQLEALHQQALLALVNLKINQTALNNATNERQLAFRDLKPYVTRLINALEVNGATDETMKDAKSINKKIRGQRATKIKDVELDGATETETKKISVSQQSFDMLIEHYTKLMELLKQQPQYKPNETDLRNEAVIEKLNQLTGTNTRVTAAYTAWSNSRIQRDKVMYDALTGMTALVLDVKKYVKSVFGAASVEYKQISGIIVRK